MKLIITATNLGLWAAQYICQSWQRLSRRPFVLGLPTGSTVEDMYAALAELTHHHKISFQQIITFNMDEYVGLPKEHPESYYSYMKQHLFDRVDLPENNIHLLDGNSPDLAAACNRYETEIKQAGGIDLFIGGIGRNGHIAFNEPGSAFDSRTREIALTASTRQANSRFFQHDITQVPTHALTVGIGTVLEAKELLFLASGETKAEAVAQLVHHSPTPQWPLTALKLHPRATLLIDAAAASQLPTDLLREWQAHNQAENFSDLILTL